MVEATALKSCSAMKVLIIDNITAKGSKSRRSTWVKNANEKFRQTRECPLLHTTERTNQVQRLNAAIADVAQSNSRAFKAFDNLSTPA